MFRKNPRFLGMKFHHITRPETLEKRYIGKMSKRAMSFLKSLLEMDPTKRCTTTEALMHPYLEK
jgi:cyclin-dependent kinase-like